MNDLKTARSPALDGIRAFAVVAVVGRHIGLPGTRQGGFGVNIFFTLSGFLITYILASEWQRTGRIDFRRFYRHRAVRLFPALALVIAAHVAYAAHQGEEQFHRAVSDLPPVVLYFGNWVRAFSHSEYALGGLGHTWSLSVEEQFYVVWPLIVALCARRWALRGVLVAALAGSVISLLLRILLWHDDGSWVRIYNGTDTEADQLLLGCALAALLLIVNPVQHDRIRTLLSRLAWPATLILVALISLWPSRADLLISHIEFIYTVGITLVAILTCVIIGHVVTAPHSALARILSFAPFVWLGAISYGIYLWHPFARDVVLSIDARWEIHVAAILLFSILLAACSFYLMERPIQRRWRSAKVVPAPSDRGVIPEPNGIGSFGRQARLRRKDGGMWAPETIVEPSDEDVVLAASAPIPTAADPAGT